MMGLPPRAAFEAMIDWHHLHEPWELLAAESDDIFLGLLTGRLATMPGLLELLAALEQAAIPKAIATSSGRRLTEACLAPFQLAPRFSFILTSEDITHGKPDPEIYLLAAQRFGVPPAEMLVLEDSQNGCRAAAASGAFTVAVPGEHSRRQDFSMANLRDREPCRSEAVRGAGSCQMTSLLALLPSQPRKLHLTALAVAC